MRVVQTQQKAFPTSTWSYLHPALQVRYLQPPSIHPAVPGQVEEHVLYYTAGCCSTSGCVFASWGFASTDQDASQKSLLDPELT